MPNSTTAINLADSLPSFLLSTLNNGLRLESIERRISAIFSAVAYYSACKNIRDSLRVPIERALNTLPSNTAIHGNEGLATKLSFLLRAKAEGLESVISKEHSYGPFSAVHLPTRLMRPGNSVKPVSYVHELRKKEDRSFSQFDPSELVWEGKWHGTRCKIFINAYPFGDNHVLIAPDVYEPREQFLLYSDHRLAFKIIHEADEIDGYVLFNAHSAHSSLPQVHFQWLSGSPMAIEDPRFKHNALGGCEEYPLTCVATTSCEDSWRFICALQVADVAHSVIYSSKTKKIYVCVRAKQGAYPMCDFVTGIAALEAGGRLILTTPNAFRYLTEQRIWQCLNLARI